LVQVHELESQMGLVVPLKEEVGQLRTRLSDHQDVKRIESARLREDCNELQARQPRKVGRVTAARLAAGSLWGGWVLRMEVIRGSLD
jgi:hypothetical protein